MAEEAKGKGAAPAADAKAAGTQPAAAAPKKMLSPKNIVIFVVMILILGGGVAGALVHLKNKKKAASSEHATEEAVAHDDPTEIEEFDPMVVNVLGTQGTRYLKVLVAIEITSPKLEEYKAQVVARKVELSDRMNAILSSKSLEDIDSPKERDDIKRQIRDEFQEVLNKKQGSIKNVFFTDFVVQ